MAFICSRSSWRVYGRHRCASQAQGRKQGKENEAQWEEGSSCVGGSTAQMTFYLFLLANVNEAFLPLFVSMNKAQKDI